jgi:hypothetical protein
MSICTDPMDPKHLSPILFQPSQSHSSVPSSTHWEHDSDFQSACLTEARVSQRLLPSVKLAVGSPTGYMVLNPACLWCHRGRTLSLFKKANGEDWRYARAGGSMCIRWMSLRASGCGGQFGMAVSRGNTRRSELSSEKSHMGMYVS